MIRALVLALVLLGGAAVAPATAEPLLPANWADILDDAREGTTDTDLDVGEEMC